MNPTIKRNNYKLGQLIVFIFISCVIISYLYVVITGTYNGDYLGVPTQLSQIELFINLIYTVTPFFILFYVYKYYKKVKIYKKITIPVHSFGYFLLFLLLFQIYVSYTYGVGKMGSAVYQVPIYVKPIIQISNKFSGLLGVFIFCLLVDSKNKLQYLLLLLLVVLSIIKASAGIFVFILFLVLIKKYTKIISFLKKYFIVVIIGFIFIVPSIISSIYEQRDKLRGNTNASFSNYDFPTLIFGKLIGRFSSFTNSAIIMEREKKITDMAQQAFSLMEYPKEAFAAFWGDILDIKDIHYLTILLDSQGDYTRVATFMTGTQGSLLIGYYQSICALFINTLTIVLIVCLSFRLVLVLQYQKILDIILVFLSFNVMSGVANEYMFTLIYVVMYLFLFLIMNSIQKYSKI